MFIKDEDFEKVCRFCGMTLTNTPWVDGKTKQGPWGPWATMCIPCHKVYGIGVGTGKGQIFDTDGKKIAG